MDDLAAMSALRLRDALARRELSVTDVTEYFLGRIRTHNERLGAFSSVDHAGALDVAQQRDREFPDDEHARPVLWGVPTADKDLSDRLGMPTGHGSAAGGEFPPESSPEVVALDRAGAVSLGKTATPEFGLYGYTSPAVGPIARHPRDGLLGAGGSSGGAATAVAAGLLPIAPGSDGGGSIRIPAASVGIVGFKPSRDLLPIDQGRGEITGVVSGALARTVEDAALMMDALGQPWSTHQPSHQQSFLSAASEGSHRATEELRIGFTLQHPWRDSVDIVIHPAVVRAFDRVVHLLSAQPNLDLSDAVTFPSTAYAPLFQRAWQRAAAGIDARFDRSRMEPVTQQLIAAGARLSPAEQAANQTALHQFGEDLARRFSKFDVVVTPALAEPWHRAEGWSEDAQENFDAQVRLAPYSSWVNVAGLPAVTLPTPMTATSPGSAELPVSIQLIGQRNTDRELIRFAAAVEALFTREAAALRR